MSGPNLEQLKNEKAYSAKDLKMSYLIGKTIVSAEINSDRDIVLLKTDTENIWLTWYGDCCAKCFIENCSGSENIIHASIESAENLEWKALKNNEDEYDVVEKMGTAIKTSKGLVRFETRLEHNGYYSGTIEVSNIAPVNEYSCYLEAPKDLKPLVDF